MTEWPKLDPITGRKVCSSCWNTVHRKKNVSGVMVSACTGECDCIHLSEENWAAIEKKKQTEAKREKKKIHKAILEDELNPLRAVNPDYQKGRLA